MPSAEYVKISFCLPRRLEKLLRRVQRADLALTSRSAAIVRLITLGGGHFERRRGRRS